jgi:hypothetical protein
MRDAETLIKGFLDDSITLKDLTLEELDCVLDELVAIGESLLDTDNHDVGVEILECLDEAIDLRSTDPSVGFEQAIIDAEARDSVYWEFEEYSVH